MFIVLEGIDLIGKTTQHDMLVGHLRKSGRDVASFSFPAYDSPTGRVISHYLRGHVALTVQDETLSLPLISTHDSLVFQCLQMVDKYAAAPEISRHLREGRDVVACRWWQSAWAYGFETEVDGEWTRRVCACLPRADLNILLDLDPRLARRRTGEAPDRMEESLDRQERIRRRYLELWDSRYDGESGYWAQVSAGGSVAEVHERILGVLDISGVLRLRATPSEGSMGR